MEINQGKILVSGVLVAAAIAIVSVLIFLNGSDHYDDEIEQILAIPQTYDGEYIDRLSSMGADAIPAVGAELSGGYAFPSVFIRSIEKIGDPSDSIEIIRFIEQTDLQDTDHNYVVIELALKALGNPNALPTLNELLSNGDLLPSTRVSAATAICKISKSEDDLFQKSVRLLVEKYENDPYRYRADYSAGYIPQVFEAAQSACGIEGESTIH